MGRAEIRVLLFMLAALCTPLQLRADECDTIVLNISNENKSLIELSQQRDELNQQFEGSVSEDFAAKSEGIIDEIQHNAALKIAYAKRRMAKALEGRKQTIVQLKAQYCNDCGKPSLDETAKAIYCERCPRRNLCKSLASAPKKH